MEKDNQGNKFLSFSSNLVNQDLKKVAEIELNENENKIPKCIFSLKELLKKEPHLIPCLDEKFLLMFLRARKFDSEAAFRLLKNYYSNRLKYSSMFRNFTPKDCFKVMKLNLHYFLPYRSPDGCAILLSKFGIWDTKLITCEELLKFNLICSEMAVQNPITQISGIITIADMKDFSWSHLLQIHIDDIRCFINTMQNCLPVRNKAIHIVHNSKVFSILFALVKPLLSEKMRKRIYFHGDDLNSLHQHIPPEILPKDLGGELSSAPNEDFYNFLLDNNDIFVEQQNYRYTVARPRASFSW